MKYSYRPERDAVDDSLRDFSPTHREFKFRNFIRTALITVIYVSGITAAIGTLAYCANSVANAEHEAQKEMDLAEYAEWRKANPPNLLDLNKENCDGGPEN